MSGLKKIPKDHFANRDRIADFAEIQCMLRADANVSRLEVARIMVRDSDGSNDEVVSQQVAEAFDRLAERARHCGPTDGGYPYEIDEQGTLLQLRQHSKDRAPLYVYLLLATQMNMKTHRNQGGHDATAIFEHLCREVAVRYWGGPSPNVQSLVFGTGGHTKSRKKDRNEKGNFQSAIDDLCKALREGHGFDTVMNPRVSACDGKLDVVVWRRFADRRGGQLIGFGQCKTGQHWRADVAKLQPEVFCRKWMRKLPAVLPVRLYFVTDRVTDHWYEDCADGGILFDRCRIVEHSDSLTNVLQTRIKTWVKAAAESENLSLP